MSPVDYHAWTHRPKALGGTDPIESESVITHFRAFVEPAGGLLVGNDIEVQVNFTEWDNEDSSVFGTTTISSGTILTTVNFKRPGVYTVTAYIWWEAQFDARIEILALDPSGTSSNWPVGLAPSNSQAGGSSEPGSQFVYPLTYSVTKKYPLMGITEADVIGANYGAVLLKVLQASGSARDLQAAMLEVFYWGPTKNAIPIS